MDELINCNGCGFPHEKSKLHYDPKKGVARFYCDECYAMKNSFTAAQAAKRNFRSKHTNTSY